MAGVEELDLTKPGKIWATPEYETTTKFYVVVPDDKYTKAKLLADPMKPPTIPPTDQLMGVFEVPHAKLDKEGRAVLDLQQSGKAKEIMNKIEERVGKGQQTPLLRVVIIADHAEGNHLPAKFAVETLDFAVASFPIIILTSPKSVLTPEEFRSGTRSLTAEFRATAPMKEVKVSINPKAEFTVNGQKGNGELVIPVKDGQPNKLEMPITIDKKDVVLLTPAEKQDFQYFVQRQGNIANWNGARMQDPTEGIPASAFGSPGMWALAVKQWLESPKPVYSSIHPWSRWREYAWNWKSPWSGKSYTIQDHDGYLDIKSSEGWGSHEFVLTVAGTGPYSSTSKQVKFSLKGWAPKVYFENLPRVLGHNAC